MRSNIEIPYDSTDAAAFTSIVDMIMEKLITAFDPDELSIIRIKNWFDHKWLNYSGKQILKYDTQTESRIPFVLEPHWNTKITIPPFHPNRVLSEKKFIKKGTDNLDFLEPFHQVQWSTENRNNLILRRLNNGLCFWISSNSEINRQGSLMVYLIKDAAVKSWYISIEEKENWKITRTKGISQKEIEFMLSSTTVSENS